MMSTLDSESRNDLIQYRLNRAFETLKEADYNAAGKYYNTAVNRLYYAAFYALNALLISKGIVCSTHQGGKSMFALHFIRPGILSIDHGKTFNQLFINRQSGDYEDFVYCDDDLYQSLRPKTESFINAIVELLNK